MSTLFDTKIGSLVIEGIVNVYFFCGCCMLCFCLLGCAFVFLFSFSILIHGVVVEGKDLYPMDSNGTSDPYGTYSLKCSALYVIWRVLICCMQ